MNQRWYYRIGTHVQGPLEFEALQALVAEGKLGVDDEVRTTRSHEWSVAATVPGLFPPDADADDLLEMLSPQPNGPTLNRRRAKRVSLCYLRTGDQVRGPIPFEQLGEMARSGELDRHAEVRMSAEAKWMKAGSIIGLFDGAAPEPTALSSNVFESRPSQQTATRRPTEAASARPATPVTQSARSVVNDAVDRTWEWESQRGGRQGPFTFEEVHEFAQTGRMQRSDKVRSGPWCQWAVADSIVGLFPETESAPVREARRAAGRELLAEALESAEADFDVAPAKKEVVSKPSRSASRDRQSAPVAASRPAPRPIEPAPPRPAPPPKPVPRAAAPVFAPVKRRRGFDFGSLFAGMEFNFNAKYAAVLGVLVVGGLLWQFGLPSFGFGSSTGPEAEARNLCMELVTLSDQDVITKATWEEFKGRAAPKAKELATALEPEGDDSVMLKVCRDYLPKIFEAGLAKRPPEWDQMLEALKPT